MAYRTIIVLLTMVALVEILLLLHKVIINKDYVRVRRYEMIRHKLNLSDAARRNIKNVTYQPKIIEKEMYLLILILTSPDKKERRDVIRNTWADCDKLHTSTQESKFIPTSITCRRVFVMGDSSKNISNVLKEAVQFQDMLILEHKETYSTIFYKTITMFRWAMDHKPKYILKADDDVYVHLPRLTLDLLLMKQDYFYGGFIWKNNPVLRCKHPSCVPKSVFRPAVYPHYCSGVAYVVSGSLIFDFLSAMNDNPAPFVDDAYIGVLLHQINVTPYSLKHFWLRFDNKRRVPDGTLMDGIIFGHYFNSETIADLHRRINSVNANETYRPYVKKKYSTMKF